MFASTISRHLAKQLIFVSLVATLVFSGPVILISLFAQLPNAVVFSHLVWPALISITSNILYHTLPAFVPAAVVFCYAGYSTNGTLVALFMAGMSVRSVRAPALCIAAGGTVVAYAMSCFVFPYTAGYLHDVLHSLEHDMNPSLLQSNRINEIDGGRQVIFFRRWLSDDAIAEVFIRETSPAEGEKVYRSRVAVFVNNSDKKGLALLDGSVQLFDAATAELRAADFDKLVLPVTEFGGSGSQRRWTAFQELGPVSFMRARERAFYDPLDQRKWLREAIKRFGIPALTLIHTLLALELLFGGGTGTGRRSPPIVRVCIVIVAIHLTFVVVAEQIGWSTQFAVGAMALFVAELAVVIGLVARNWEPSWVLPGRPAGAGWPQMRAAHSLAVPSAWPPRPAEKTGPDNAWT